MKKCFFYAGALAMLLSSCSNDDVPTGPVQGSGGVESAVRDLTIAITGSSTKAGASQPGEGTENVLGDTYVFFSYDKDGPDTGGLYDYAYDYKKLTGSQRKAVVQHAEKGSRVFVLSNMPSLTDDRAAYIVTQLNAQASIADKKAYMESLEGVIEKSYLAKLNTSTGSFIMSGYNDVPGTTNGATVLPIQLDRDLAKVRFNVSRGGEGTPVAGDFKVASVSKISVRRAVQHIAPFRMEGFNKSSYALLVGVGESGYKQDGWVDASNSFNVDNDAVSSADVTDYTFDYEWKGANTTTHFEFTPFYVFPNAAKLASRGTIIVLEANIEKYENNAWVPVQGVRYYKARISEDLLSFNTQKNAQYVINAKITGEGSTVPGGSVDPDSPDLENPDSNLSIEVSVNPWSIVSSDQELN